MHSNDVARAAEKLHSHSSMSLRLAKANRRIPPVLTWSTGNRQGWQTCRAQYTIRFSSSGVALQA